MGKHQGWISVRCNFKRKDVEAWLHGSCDCSIAVLSLGEFQGTGMGHVLSRSIREKGTDASAVTQGYKSFECRGENRTREC